LRPERHPAAREYPSTAPAGTELNPTKTTRSAGAAGVGGDGGPVGLALCLDVIQNFIDRQEIVAVAVHVAKFLDRFSALHPLVESDLHVAVGVELGEPRRQFTRQLAGTINGRLLFLLIVRIVGTGWPEGVHLGPLFADLLHTRREIGLVLGEVD